MEILSPRKGRLRFDLCGNEAVKVNGPFDAAGEIRALIEGQPMFRGNIFLSKPIVIHCTVPQSRAKIELHPEERLFPKNFLTLSVEFREGKAFPSRETFSTEFVEF